MQFIDDNIKISFSFLIISQYHESARGVIFFSAHFSGPPYFINIILNKGLTILLPLLSGLVIIAIVNNDLQSLKLSRQDSLILIEGIFDPCFLKSLCPDKATVTFHAGNKREMMSSGLIVAGLRVIAAP